MKLLHELSKQSSLPSAHEQSTQFAILLHTGHGHNNITPMVLTEAQRKDIAKADLTTISKATLARRYRCSVATITRWVEEGKKPRPNYAGIHKPGRPRKLARTRAAAARRSAKAGSSARQLAARETANTHQPVSSSTLSREMHRGNIDLRYMPVTHGRTLRPDNANTRATFCQDHQNAHTKKWVFVDSKILYVYKCKSGVMRAAWQDPANPTNTPRGGSPYVLHFYAGVGHGFKSELIFTAPTPPLGTNLHKRDENFSSKHFIKEVLPKLQQQIEAHYGRDYKVCLDGATAHTCGDSQAAMAASGFNLVEDFPHQSWDINIIENCWGILVEKMQRRRPRTPRGWREALQEEWGNIQQSSINKLVGRVKSRMRQIVEIGGEWLTKYVSKGRK